MSSDGNGESVSIALRILAIVAGRTFSPFITRSIVGEKRRFSSQQPAAQSF
jgi:hypothetical protein